MGRITEGPIAAIDVETTGFSRKHGRIVEVACVVWRNGEWDQSFKGVTLVDPMQPIPAEVSKVHNIFDRDVVGKPTWSMVGPRLLDRIESIDAEGGTLTAYNGSFDRSFINAEQARVGGRLLSRRIVDPYGWAQHTQPGAVKKLSYMCKRFGVQMGDAHTALADAQATVQLLLAMISAGIIPDDTDEAIEIVEELDKSQMDLLGGGNA